MSTTGRRNRRWMVVLALVGLLPGGAWGERPKYRVRVIEPYPEPRVMCGQPQALNNQNVLTGTSEGPATRRATRWYPDGTIEPLDYSAFPRARGCAINASNWVGGYSYYTWDMWEAAVWAPDGTCTPLGGLWQNYPGLSEVRGINDAGVAAGVSSTDTDMAHAFRWTAESGMEDIGSLGGPGAVARSINNEGVIVGLSWTKESAKRAFQYQGGTMTALSLLPGGTFGEAQDINDLGQVVGLSDPGPTGARFDGGIHAVLWETTVDARGPLDLGVPIEGGQSWAAAINNRGQVVGNAEDPNNPGDWNTPWIWEAGVMRKLQDLIPPGTDWVLYQVQDINDNGWIAGQSYGAGDRGFVLIPLEDGDSDYDGDVDWSDAVAFLECLYGPDVYAQVGCVSADIDEDRDVDVPDLARLQQTFGG